MEMKIFDTGDHILRAVNSSHAAYVLQKKLSRDYYNWTSLLDTLVIVKRMLQNHKNV